MGIVLILILISIGYYQFQKRTHLCTPYPFMNIQQQESDSIISIIIIGDSWGDLAFQNQMPQTLDSMMLIYGVNTHTMAKGEHGAISRKIYKNLFMEKNDINSTRALIEQNPQYAIVFCGMNDSHGQYGKEFYIYHTSLIIQTLLHYHIKPILLELPMYNITKQYAYYPYYKKLMYRILSWFTDKTTHIKNVERYRIALREKLTHQGLYDKIQWVSIDSLCTKDFYKDYMHLNKKGYQHLSQIIATTILNDLELHNKE